MSRTRKFRGAATDDSNLCPLCLRQTNEWNYHHIIAAADGGTDHYSNVLRICQTCHAIITNEDAWKRQVQLEYEDLDAILKGAKANLEEEGD